MTRVLLLVDLSMRYLPAPAAAAAAAAAASMAAQASQLQALEAVEAHARAPVAVVARNHPSCLVEVVARASFQEESFLALEGALLEVRIPYRPQEILEEVDPPETYNVDRSRRASVVAPFATCEHETNG